MKMENSAAAKVSIKIRRSVATNYVDVRLVRDTPQLTPNWLYRKNIIVLLQMLQSDWLR